MNVVAGVGGGDGGDQRQALRRGNSPSADCDTMLMTAGWAECSSEKPNSDARKPRLLNVISFTAP